MKAHVVAGSISYYLLCVKTLISENVQSKYPPAAAAAPDDRNPPVQSSTVLESRLRRCPPVLALMSPDGSDRERSPLEPVKDNILPVAGEPPPLELPDPLKGAQAIDDVPEELMQEADPESGDSAETLPSLASSSSSAGTSAGPVLAASDEALLHVQRSQPLAMPMKRDSTGMPTERPEFGLSSSAPAFASSAPAFAFSQPRPASLTVSRNEDDGAASAIQALLTATVTVTVTLTLALTGSP